MHLSTKSRADPGLAPPGPPAGEPNEDGIVGGPRTPQQIAAQRRLQQTQAQVDEVNNAMSVNRSISRHADQTKTRLLSLVFSTGGRHHEDERRKGART